jgi:hypothetical protein
MAWMQRFEIYDFVCKKVGITRDWESRGDLRYRQCHKFVQFRRRFLHELDEKAII